MSLLTFGTCFRYKSAMPARNNYSDPFPESFVRPLLQLDARLDDPPLTVRQIQVLALYAAETWGVTEVARTLRIMLQNIYPIVKVLEKREFLSPVRGITEKGIARLREDAKGFGPEVVQAVEDAIKFGDEARARMEDLLRQAKAAKERQFEESRKFYAAQAQKGNGNG